MEAIAQIVREHTQSDDGRYCGGPFCAVRARSGARWQPVLGVRGRQRREDDARGRMGAGHQRKAVPVAENHRHRRDPVCKVRAQLLFCIWSCCGATARHSTWPSWLIVCGAGRTACCFLQAGATLLARRWTTRLVSPGIATGDGSGRQRRATCPRRGTSIRPSSWAPGAATHANACGWPALLLMQAVFPHIAWSFNSRSSHSQCHKLAWGSS